MIQSTGSQYFLPLATRMRPRNLDEYVGQTHILGDGQLLAENIKRGQVHSMVFWGPPGVEKTTLAKMIANYANAAFIEISAVLSGVKYIREAIEQAKNQQIQFQKQTCLFVDEVHRFNKSK